jgi:hypothetical protein
MKAFHQQAKWVVGMGACAGALLGLSGTALAGDLSPTDTTAPEMLPPPAADRPTDNVPANTDSTERKAKNLVYLELLGNGGLYSINYERMLGNDLSARLGFSYFSVGASTGDSSAKATLVTAPLMLNYLVGGKNHKFEVGAGATMIYVSASSSGAGMGSSAEGVGVAGTGTVGYRYSPNDGGFVFRVGYTPFFGKGGYQSWGGMSFGGTF